MIRTVTPIQLIISADSNDIHPPTGAVQTYGNMICLPDYKMATVTLKGYVKRSVQLIIKKSGPSPDKVRFGRMNHKTPNGENRKTSQGCYFSQL